METRTLTPEEYRELNNHKCAQCGRYFPKTGLLVPLHANPLELRAVNNVCSGSLQQPVEPPLILV